MKCDICKDDFPDDELVEADIMTCDDDGNICEGPKSHVCYMCRTLIVAVIFTEVTEPVDGMLYRAGDGEMYQLKYRDPPSVGCACNVGMYGCGCLDDRYEYLHLHCDMNDEAIVSHFEKQTRDAEWDHYQKKESEYSRKEQECVARMLRDGYDIDDIF